MCTCMHSILRHILLAEICIDNLIIMVPNQPQVYVCELINHVALV